MPARGSSVNSPAVSVRRTSSLAPTRWATRAARRSLSPNRISSSATASFSLTTGTTPSSSSRARVWRACRYWLRCTKSSGASSTWPATSPRRPRASLHTFISRCCPTAATAWRVAGSAGRGRPGARLVQPAAMAPEVTTTTRSPARPGGGHLGRPACRWRPRRPRPPAVVTEDEPILTTTVRSPRPPCADASAASRRRDDRGPAVSSGWSRYQTNDMPPISTVSPSRAPARARARSTPSRRSRCCTKAAASSVVRSLRATARSAARPASRKAPGPARSTSNPSGSGRWTTMLPPGLGLEAAVPVDQPGEPADQLVEAGTGHGRHPQVGAGAARVRPPARRRRPWTRPPAAAGRPARAGTARARRAGPPVARAGVTPVTGSSSTTRTSTRARVMWRRKRWPRPLPSAAPSTRPGMSATVKSDPSPVRTTPRWGSRVVKG